MIKTNVPQKKDFMERFSISTVSIRGYEPVSAESLAKIAATGVAGIELLQCPDQYSLEDPQSFQNIKRNCDDFGLSILALHSHYITFDEVDTIQDLLKKLDVCYRQLDNLAEAGGQFWACHAHRIRDVEKRAFEALGRYCENLPLRIGIENFIHPGMWPSDRLEYLKELNHPKVGFLLDIGHVRDLSGINPMTRKGQALEVIRKAGSLLFHVHLHGFEKGVDHYPPFSENDEICWTDVFQGLNDIGYDGLYNFEPKGMPRHRDTFEKVKDFYDNLAAVSLP